MAGVSVPMAVKRGLSIFFSVLVGVYGAAGLAVKGLEALGLVTTVHDLGTDKSGTRVALADFLGLPWWIYAAILLAITAVVIWRFHQLTEPPQPFAPSQPGEMRPITDPGERVERAEYIARISGEAKDEALKRNVGLTARLQAIERDSSAVNLKWVGVTSLVVSYRRVTHLIPILESACERMDARIPSTDKTTHEMAVAIQRAADTNEDEFAKIRPRLVQIMTEMRASHGLLEANLTDQKLTNRVAGSPPIRDMIEGLNAIALKLRGQIADEAIHAVEYKVK